MEQTEFLPKEKKKRKSPKRKFINVHLKTSTKDNKLVLMKTIKYKNIILKAGYKSKGLVDIVRRYPPNFWRAAIIRDAINNGYKDEFNTFISKKIGQKYFMELLRLDGVSNFNGFISLLKRFFNR